MLDVRLLSVIVAVFIIVALDILVLIARDRTPPKPIRRCNNGTNLCNARVNDILFATLHNAASTTADNFTLLPNHERNLSEALIAGYRGINVDIGICNGVLGLVHSTCVLGFANLTTTFAEIAAFMEKNVNEVLLMPTELNFDTGGAFSLLQMAALMPMRFRKLLYQHPNVTTPWPTLGELIDANQRILFFHYNGERCNSTSSTTCPFGFMNWFDYAAESEFSFANTSALNNKESACNVTRGRSSTSFYGVNIFPRIANVQACVVLNDAEFLRTHIAACANITRRDVNLILIDCWEIGGALAVVQEYNDAL